MSEPFTRDGATIRVRLRRLEQQALATLPDLIEHGGAIDRLAYRAHPDDPERDAEFQALVAGSLAGMRHEDHRRFVAGLAGGVLEGDDAEAWLRVIGEARLVLATALGIDHDGWEEEADPEESPEMALLSYLGFLQDRLVTLLL